MSPLQQVTYALSLQKEKKKYGDIPLEVTNYDPVLPFRAVRLLIRQSFSFTGYSFTAFLKVMSFMHQSVDMIEAEIHVITNSGHKFVLPAMTFFKPASSKGSEVVLNGQLYGKLLDCNFSDLKEAKIYVRQYVTGRDDYGAIWRQLYETGGGTGRKLDVFLRTDL